MNIAKASDILKQLAGRGVNTLCLCPGARNAPFVQILSQSHGFEVLSFYDERSAGFFALGRARRDLKPVAVLTTSGTAVSELLSPVIEAFYTDTPLIVISSDRPKRLRGTGAPQAIGQSKIFAGYVEKSWDISASENFELNFENNKPQHLNVCFDEPLIDQELSEVVNFEIKKASPRKVWDQEPILNQELQSPLVIVGGLKKEDRKSVESALQNFNAPIFVESSSGLRESLVLKDRILNGGEKIVSKMLKSGDVKSVLRLGDVPLGRFWRDLDLLEIPTLSINNKKFSGTEKSEIVVNNLKELSLTNLTPASWDWHQWRELGEQASSKLQESLEQNPQSEPAFFKKLVEQIPKNEPVYIGNSMPVRLWDLVSNKDHQIFGNRGANGIDGQISSAFGLLKPQTKNWIILGDLTTLYDFNGFWITDYLRSLEISINLVVINNGGGQIFSRIFSEELFRNQHTLNFEPMAKMWGWNYLEIKSPSEELPSDGLNLIEIKPDEDQSRNFWETYDKQWE